MSTVVEKPQVRKSEFIKLAQNHTKAQIAAHYGLTEKNVVEIARRFNVKFKKRKEDDFVLLFDDEDQVVDSAPIIPTETPFTEKEALEFLNNVPVTETFNITNTSVPVDTIL